MEAAHPAGVFGNSLAWFAQTVRFLAWTVIGLALALASYAFGMGALIFGVLGHLQQDAQWWPAILCLLFGYFSVRSAVVCMDSAFKHAARSRSGGFEPSTGGD